ncbi:hypothetical protein B296_00023684 [Ensete ventricosum]|uniref:Uncharacterized protein n=1 Tax=Ensete ventricosum TaxID=4639 RepID=A0A427AWI3_ENSVE|nr:hypothetical protein B296_00023684 [Ensete ventricosum]
MSSSSLRNERNVGGCSPSGSSSSLDEKGSKALEAILIEHDEDSIITESFMLMIRSRYYISLEYDLHVPEVRDAPSNNKGWKSCFFFMSALRGWGLDLKCTGHDVDNTNPLLSKDEAGKVVYLRRIIFSSKSIKSMSEDWLVEEGLNLAPKGTAHSVFVVCCISLLAKAWSQDESFLTEEIANLPELSGESSHEGHWATLIAKSQVWVAKLLPNCSVRCSSVPPRHSKLEIEEDKYATFLEENVMSMEVGYMSCLGELDSFLSSQVIGFVTDHIGVPIRSLMARSQIFLGVDRVTKLGLSQYQVLDLDWLRVNLPGTKSCYDIFYMSSPASVLWPFVL